LKFLIFSYEYNWRVGGIVALHKLAELISGMSYETFLLNGEKSKAGGATCVGLEEALEIARDPQTVVIYPEVVFGNPLNANRVARWVLYFPGVNGGEIKYESSEFVFTWSKAYVKNSIYESTPVLNFTGILDNYFSDLNLTRSNDAILIKKGNNEMDKRASIFLHPHTDSRTQFESADKIIDKATDISDFNLQLNKIRYFVSYDNYTYHSVFAALAGCVSIVIPELDRSSEAFFDLFPEAKIAGVSYGFEEHNRNSLNLDSYKLEKYRIDSKNFEAMENLIPVMTNHFEI
jgi:hypothetical protein